MIFQHINSNPQEFEEVAEALRTKGEAVAGLPDDKKLEIYALFKQGSTGDNTTTRPGMLDFKGKAKWDAWEAKKGLSQEEAQREYIELVGALMN